MRLTLRGKGHGEDKRQGEDDCERTVFNILLVCVGLSLSVSELTFEGYDQGNEESEGDGVVVMVVVIWRGQAQG